MRTHSCGAVFDNFGGRSSADMLMKHIEWCLHTPTLHGAMSSSPTGDTTMDAHERRELDKHITRGDDEFVRDDSDDYLFAETDEERSYSDSDIDPEEDDDDLDEDLDDDEWDDDEETLEDEQSEDDGLTDEDVEDEGKPTQ